MTGQEFTQRVACKAIIVRDNKILLMRESPRHIDNTKAGQYQFPGGRIEPGEPFLDGLLREIEEETRLEITIGKPFFIGEWMPKVREQKHHIVAIFFECKHILGEVFISEEHDDFQWIDLLAAKNLNVMAPDDEVARTYLKQLN